tara:strand:- start:1611 stop:2567 length:957 start_codon:yes stop_codon:yes gene_type:complete
LRVLRLRPAPEGPETLVAQFGIGLLGSSILRALRVRGQLSEERLPLGWDLCSEQGGAELAAIGTRLEELLDQSSARELSVVWSAGRAGFSATPAETEAELASYQAALDWAAALGERVGRPTSFHLLSSAGGLFEGSGLVTSQSAPAPQRPYGELKLRQEQALGERSLLARIYRPTTVYGFLHPRHRQGLIQTLLLRAIRHQVTQIYGGLATLRDFVYSEDVGEFVARQVLSESPSPTDTFLLGSGKPSSIFEVRRIVERLLGRKVYVSVRSTPTNSANLTYHSSAFPERWTPSELQTGIRQIQTRWARRGMPLDPLRG